MTSRRAVVMASLSAALVLAGCGQGRDPRDPGVVSPPSWQLRYRLSGGAESYDVVFVVDANGEARYARRNPRPENRFLRLEPAEVQALASTVESSGFVALAPLYRPSQPMKNGHRYSIEWEQPTMRHGVVAEDGAVLPEPFVSVREAVAVLQRRVLRDGRVVGAANEGKE